MPSGQARARETAVLSSVDAGGTEGGSGSRAAIIRHLMARPLPAAVLLLLGYSSLSLLLDPGGYLGTDTGTKVHTLEVMDRRDTFSPAIGYWAAEHDPSGSLHPLHQTSQQADGSWVGVTTLPMLQLGQPLYEVGGYRAALILPMLGGIGAAFAARSISRRLDPLSEGWLAYWVVGLASPLLIYALDFWEHSVGVACVLGGVAALLGVLEGRAAWWAVAAGVLFGAGAVMRQEVLVYALVSVGAVCAVLLVERRRLWMPAIVGAATVVGFAAPWLANAALESSVEGQSRAGRSTGTASAAVTSIASGSRVGERIEEGFQTLLGLVSGDAALSTVLGIAIVAAVIVASRAEGRGDRGFAVVALMAAALVYVADAVGGLGFIPGMLIAFPLAIGGLLSWRCTNARGRLLVVIAVGALPIVYAFQYLGGAAPQWGGRYTLTSGVLLGAVAVSGLRTARPVTFQGLLGLSVVATVLGVAWLVERTQAVDRFFEQVVAEAEPVVIARQAFLLREGGASTVGRRWLSPDSEQEFARAVDIARTVGEERFTVLEWDGEAPPAASLPEDVREVRRVHLRFVDTPVGLVTYRFTD